MVKCKDCGYLGVREANGTQLVNPDKTQREVGRAINGITEHCPVCAIAAFDLPAEHRDPPGMNPSEHAANIMAKDRECHQFTDNMPGLSPKEHIDMNLLAQNQRYLECQNRRNLITNVTLVIVGLLAAIAAWWGALHPVVVPPPVVNAVIQSPPTPLPPQTIHRTSIRDP